MRWLVVLFILLSIRAAEAAAHGIWIDTDPSIGAPWREVDDAFALVLAFHSPETRIVGISTTYGNAGLRRTTFVARDLVRRFGASAGLSEGDVFAGVASPREIGKGTAANDALAQTLQKKRLTYVALGPLTNLAAFVRQHPELSRRIEQVVFVGGKTPGQAIAFGPTGALRVHDANVFKDPDAVRAIMKTKIPLLLAPAETSSRLMLDRQRWQQLRGSVAAADFLSRKSRFWIWFWRDLVREEGGPLFDALAILAVTRPDLVATEERYAVVDRSGDLLAERQHTVDSRPVRFCKSIATNASDVVLQRLMKD